MIFLIRPVRKIIGFPIWEEITHVAVFLLHIYLFYSLYKHPEERTIGNLSLLLIALALSVLIHQNINERNEVYDKNED
jgi:hypothetical protein